MDIDFKNPKVIRWLIAGLLVVVLVPGYLFTSVLPFTYPVRQVEYTDLQAKHEKLSRDLEKARLLVRNLDRVEREYEILHRQWEVAQTLLPEQNEMASLLRKITAAGQQSGIEFELFRPAPLVNRGFYSDNPVEVVVQGGYHQTAVFLSRLANLNRIVNVAQIALTEVSRRGDEDSSYSVKTALTVTAYTQAIGQGQISPEGETQQQLAVAATTTGKTTAQAGAH